MARRVIATQVDSNGFELSGAVPLWLAVWLPHGCQLLTTRIFFYPLAASVLLMYEYQLLRAFSPTISCKHPPYDLPLRTT
jgi:hypothetical protein